MCGKTHLLFTSDESDIHRDVKHQINSSGMGLKNEFEEFEKDMGRGLLRIHLPQVGDQFNVLNCGGFKAIQMGWPEVLKDKLTLLFHRQKKVKLMGNEDFPELNIHGVKSQNGTRSDLELGTEVGIV